MGRRLRVAIAYLLGLFAAGILAYAAFAKAGDPALFAEQITAHRVTPPAWSPFIAYFFIAVELLAAAAFIAFIWPRLLFSATILMMVVFVVVTAIAWAQGNTEGCGCFGRLVERGPREVIVEDALVILSCTVGLLLLRDRRQRPPAGGWLFGGIRVRPWQWLIATPLVGLALVLTVFGRDLPIDPYVIGIDRGADLSNMALEGLRSPIDENRVLVALVGPDCERCSKGVAALKEVVARDLGVEVVAAHPGEARDAQRWRLKHLPNFPVAYATPRALRQYYRELPTVFLLHDGIVARAWWGRIPSADEVAAHVSPG